MPQSSRVSLSIADTQDRRSIYASRHQVYARELAQHRENTEGSNSTRYLGQPTDVYVNPDTNEAFIADG